MLQTVLTPMADLVQTSMKALLSEISRVPLPLCDQRGGSSCPWGSRPFSRQERNASRCPPLGKWMGGLCTPSCPTNTMVPPQSAVRQGEHLKSYQETWIYHKIEGRQDVIKTFFIDKSNGLGNRQSQRKPSL